MKPSMALKPLVFAIAAVMAVAVQAGQNDRRGHHHNHHQKPPTKISVYADASAYDKQSSTNNYIVNEGTENDAEMSSSASGTSGNVGVNVAAGNGNQQDNAAAIANAGSVSEIDNTFVFGDAESTARVTQYSNNNKVYNHGATNSAVMSGSGENGSGNMGINIAAGDLNQQKNTMAIANTNAPLGNASATASAEQSGPGLVVINNADRTYRVDTLTFTTDISGSSSREKSFEASGSQSRSSSFEVAGSKSHSASGSNHYEASGSNMHKASGSKSFTLDADLEASFDASKTVSWDYGRHHNGEKTKSVEAELNASLYVDVDKSWEKKNSSSFEKERDSSFEKKFESSFEKSGSKSSESEWEKAKSFSESDSFELSKTVSFQVLTPTGWANPVTNTATLSGSVNGGSGNLGVNVAAGVGNQQSNSLAISNTSM
ncbi:heme utilization protein [Pseudomonas sp. BJa5]|uniref:heme utilization protein n=1 Tax=Pseudomonas sp. BJa5 TaxID=2936270 RepID=UPI0025599B3D|nr:heme utilization protein [Pseudomonas sp. BGr12]MDL2423367.1 heme utilization protein [Pseudomonas sp. BGr12]